MTTIRCILAASLLVSALSAQGLPPVPVPAGNPMTREKSLLGKTLFWDEQLSSTRTVACGTCHIPSGGGADPRAFEAGAVSPGRDGLLGTADDVRGSPGVIGSLADGTLQLTTFGLRPQVTPRRAPTVINAAYLLTLFWDGRAQGRFVDPLDPGSVLLERDAAAESLAAQPPINSIEMGHFGRQWPDVVAQIAASRPLAVAAELTPDLVTFVEGRSYADLYREAFGSAEVTPARTAMAIATYLRTQISGGSRYDAFVQGSGTLDEREQRGLLLFNTLCFTCHTDLLPGAAPGRSNAFTNTGVRPIDEDVGRFAVTGLESDKGRFRTPALRNVALRAPFFHNGGARTLRDVIDFYDRGGDFHVNQDPRVRPLGLTEDDKQALVAFLEALTDPRVRDELPPFDRPRLYSESDRVPTVYGVPTQGAGAFAPRMVAAEPPLVGSPSFAIGFEDGPAGGSPAVLALDIAPARPATLIAGVRVNLGLTPLLTPTTTVFTIGGQPGTGWASVSLAIPELVELRGVSLYAQWWIADSGSPIGIAATRGVEFRLF